jgi:hypothetical protein
LVQRKFAAVATDHDQCPFCPAIKTIVRLAKDRREGGYPLRIHGIAGQMGYSTRPPLTKPQVRLLDIASPLHTKAHT